MFGFGGGNGLLEFSNSFESLGFAHFVAAKCEGSKVELLNDEMMLTSGGFWRGLVHGWYLIDLDHRCNWNEGLRFKTRKSNF